MIPPSLVFATNNLHKKEEISHILKSEIHLLTLREIGCFDELPEEQETLEGNALQKARYVRDIFGYDCFADDTGLEVEALDGAPGVYSARYAGLPGNSENNIRKLLSALEGEINRKARFRTVIALLIEGRELFFEGIVEGTILTEKHGSDGFGYDPVFQPHGYEKSFAEMSLEEKNLISHRALATKALAEYLNR